MGINNKPTKMEVQEPKLNTTRLLAIAFGSVCLGILSFIVFFFIAYQIALAVSPPYVVDEQTGEKHTVMVIGQASIGLMIGILAGMATLVLSYRYFKRKTLES
jgi:uncharacterized membrane protein SpoIIM required for sporulation